jgi:ubiquinone/menaquinone biosynthesis C-methylase UbiE
MSLLVPPRRPSREILDDESLPSEEMYRSLRDLSLVNRRWGASRALERYLVPRLKASVGGRVVILDLGAGSAETSGRLRDALARAGCGATVVGLDIQWRHLAAGRRLMGRSAPPPAVAADAFRLPFRDGAADWAVSTLFFHHFSPAQNMTLLKEMTRVARRGFAILDLARNRISLAFVRVAGRLLFESPISVEDGAASVRQAYTREEALSLARAAVPLARVEKVFPFRLLISGPVRREPSGSV